MRVANIPLEKHGGKQTPKGIVIHSIGEFIDTEGDDYFAPEFLRKIGLSAHYFITPTGVVIRSVDDDTIAWHAKGFNTDSIGIEFMVPGLHTYSTFIERIQRPYLSKTQYAAGVKLVKDLCTKYDIKYVKTHSELSPQRKHDPGAGFPLCKFMDEVKGV